MSGLEQAIRNALERAERSDPDIRARIYQSARNALDVGLSKQQIADPGVIDRQRQRLEATINEIEDEELERLRSIARFEKVAIEREPDLDDEVVSDYPPGRDAAPDIVPDREPVREAPQVFATTPVQPQTIRVEPVRSEPARNVGAEPQPASPVLSEPVLAADEPLDAEFADEPPRLQADRAAQPASSRAAPTIAMDVDAPQRDARNAGAVDDGALSGLSAMRDGGNTRQALPGGKPVKQKKAKKSRQDEALAAYAAEDIAPGRKRGGIGSFFISTFVYLFLLGIIAGGVWWVYATGMIDAALKGSSDFKLVPEALQSESRDPAANRERLETLRGFSGDWINIYKPGADVSAVTVRSKATIEEHRDSDGLATVIRSNAPDQDGDVLVAIPAAFLQEMSGKTSTIAVTVKSNSDKPAQIYVQCEFKSLGDCGRHRYTVTNELADKLIQVKFEGKLAPSTPGHIVINGDLTGEGASIRLYGIRVLPGS